MTRFAMVLFRHDWYCPRIHETCFRICLGCCRNSGCSSSSPLSSSLVSPSDGFRSDRLVASTERATLGPPAGCHQSSSRSRKLGRRGSCGAGTGLLLTRDFPSRPVREKNDDISVGEFGADKGASLARVMESSDEQDMWEPARSGSPSRDCICDSIGGFAGDDGGVGNDAAR